MLYLWSFTNILITQLLHFRKLVQLVAILVDGSSVLLI